MTNRSIPALADLLRQEDGQGMVEYGLILSLVAVACIASMTTLGTNVKNVLTQAATGLAGGGGGGAP